MDRGRSTAESFQGRPSHAQWATVFAASSIADTVTSGCAIMLGWSPPGTWRIFDFARVANLFRISGGMTLSASPMTYHEGIVFQPIAAGALSVKQRAAKGRWVAARRAATSGNSADAKIAPKYFAFT